nr:hypothetical protein [uncultured Holophaga sp.]
MTQLGASGPIPGEGRHRTTRGNQRLVLTLEGMVTGAVLSPADLDFLKPARHGVEP